MLRAGQKKKEPEFLPNNVKDFTRMEQKVKCQNEPEIVPSEIPPAEANGNCDASRESSSANRSRRFTERLRRDPERYKLYRKKENERITKSKQRRTEEPEDAQMEKVKL